MTFKDLKNGYIVYLLHKGEKIIARQGKVVSVSQSRLPNFGNPFQTGSQFQSMVVDVTIEEGGEQKTYTIPENLELTYAGADVILSTTKEGIIREIEAVRSKADEIIANAPKQEEIRKECEGLLAELNPIYKEKRANDERFGKLETQIGELSSLVKNFISKLS